MRIVAPLWRATYLRYVGASVIALAADLALFLALNAAGVSATAASAIGYAAGILVHWLVSSRAVFADRVGDGMALRTQQVQFVASALLGLAITVAVVALGTHAGLDPRLAKLVAIGVSFQVTYLIRARLVFA